MDGMNTNITNLSRSIWGLALGIMLIGSVANAQSPSTSNNNAAKSAADKKTGQSTASTKSATAKKSDIVPTSQTVGEDAGNFTIVSSIEFGYRGQRVDGDVNKYKSDLNYKAGPRLFDTSFLMKSKDGKGGLFDTLLVTSTGWGADPSGSMRIDAENPKWYRFEGTYRRFKYYRFLNSIVNPNWTSFAPPVPPNPVTGLHGYDTYTKLGDFDLTILPKNETIRFNVGFSPERYSGPAFTNYHNGGNEFWLLSNMRSQANDFRFGADGKVGPIDWTFLQGFRRFKDDSFIDQGIGLNTGATAAANSKPAQLTSFLRQDPTRGSIDYTRGSIHTFLANKLDITGRIIYSKSTSNSLYDENFAGTNFSFRITGFPPTGSERPNVTNPSFYNIAGHAERPNTVGDVGVTYLATDKLRISNTFRVEDFTIDGIGTFSNFLSINRVISGVTRTDIFTATNRQAFETTHYRKYLNTIEGDYQISRKYAFHFGYRYGHRRDQRDVTGFENNSNSPALRTTSATCNPCEEHEIQSNTTNAFFGGFKAVPVKNWSIYFDAEHGTADNVFTRIGNYNYTNIRAKSRYSPNRKLNFNVAVITRDNSNPSEIAGISLSDFGVDIKSRTFTSSVDWTPTPRLALNFGYNYNWVNSDSVIDYYYQVPPAATVFHHFGHALYFMRNNFFYIDATTRVNRRMTLYTSYRINQDGGQGNQVADPTGGTPIPGGIVIAGSLRNPANLGGTLVSSYPMNFQSVDSRLAIMINRHLDWNLGYQYYAYNESDFLNTFPGSPRAQNYHAHLPYMSLRIYIGRKE
jgi:hypothetical protein